MGGEREEQDVLEKHLQRSEMERQRDDSRDGTTRFPTRQPSRQHPSERDRGREYGRSTSGGHGGANRRYTRRDGRDDLTRNSKASTVVTDVNEPGIYGQGGMFMYDNGVREGLVMSRYD